MMRIINRLALALLLTGIFSGLAEVRADTGESPSKPNIILIFIDDMGWADFSCFGNKDASTPNIDALATEGIAFEQFYVNSPICSPSRVAISTGQYPQRWGITSYLSNRADNNKRGMVQWLDPKAPMLARSLKKAGYKTGHFGKWHMGGQRDVKEAPEITSYGFDEYLTNFEGIGAKLLPLITRKDGTVGRIWQHAEMLGEPVVWMQRSQITTGFADAAIAFINKAQQEGKPFYLNLWPDDVHGPFWPSHERLKKAGNYRELYLAVLEEMDTQFAQLFDRVKADPALKTNTIILICSDNGPSKGAGKAGPLKGFKTHLYEGGVRSPLIVWAPGLIDKQSLGSRNTESVLSAMDLVPSLLSLGGTAKEADAHYDGENMKETLLGNATASRKAPLFFSRPPDRKSFYGFKNLPDLAVRSGKWKLLCDYDGSRAELYDLSADPGEANNLAETHAEKARQLTRQVMAWHHTISKPTAAKPAILDHTLLKSYVERFNADDEEMFSNIKNKDAYAFLENNIPLFDCPDEDFRRTYYFRWWTYRKHVKNTPDGYVVTEFMPKVSWAGKHNTISCPAAHHFYEGRWLHDPKVMDDYATFWLRKGGSPRSYSFWIADAYYNRNLVTPNNTFLTDLLPDLIKNYQAWEQGWMWPPWKKEHQIHIGQRANGLFYTIDDRDGGEASIGKHGFRPTLNSFMYGDAKAIAQIARMADKDDIAKEYEHKAATLKKLIQEKLWDPEAQFFKILSAPHRKDLPSKNEALKNVRELYGYTPWYFNLPDPGYEAGWKELMDPKGFYAKFGPTFAEQRHPEFKLSYEGHECQWNGPSWPLATCSVLTALANLLNNYDQDVIGKDAYFETLKCYTKSHQLKREDGKVVPWIDENIHPYTGDWISRTRLHEWAKTDPELAKRKGGHHRGKDYNHSTYNDLIITGLVGLRPQADDTVEINPLLPEGTWDYFCLDNVLYHGRILTILWDKTGEKYGKGKGLTLLIDGQKAAHSLTLAKITAQLP